MRIYDKDLSKDEVIEFVTKHRQNILNSKKDRFHTIINLFDNSSGKNVLDYGCGWGVYSYELYKRGFNVTAIDISSNEIDICKCVWKENDKLKFINTKIYELPSSYFDFVLSNQVIEHVHNPGLYLSEINRVLKLNGFLIISTPNIINPMYIFSMLSPNIEKRLITESEFYLDNYDKTHHHINLWEPTHFNRLLASCGFKLIKYVPTEGVPLPQKLKLKDYIYPKNRYIRNLSYTMTFKFQKVKDITISPEM